MKASLLSDKDHDGLQCVLEDDAGIKVVLRINSLTWLSVCRTGSGRRAFELFVELLSNALHGLECRAKNQPTLGARVLLEGSDGIRKVTMVNKNTNMVSLTGLDGEVPWSSCRFAD